MDNAEAFGSGHVAQDIDNEEIKYLKENYFIYSDGAVSLQPGGWILPTPFSKFADIIYKYRTRESDVYLNTFPKSGTYWMQYILWNLINNPNLDNPKGNLSMDVLCPLLEVDVNASVSGALPLDPQGETMKAFESLCPEMNASDGVFLQLAAHAPDPRLVKHHLPLCLLSPSIGETCKLVYLARDPRDVIISLHHFAKLHFFYGFKGTLDNLIDDFVQDRILYGPYWQHVKLAWEKRKNRNVCFVFYEDLKSDPISEVSRIDRFLGTNRTNEQIQNIVHFSSFSEMKEKYKHNEPTSDNGKYFNPKVKKEEGGFFRKGEVGDWKNKFSDEQLQKVNNWIARNLAQFEDDFKYKL